MNTPNENQQNASSDSSVIPELTEAILDSAKDSEIVESIGEVISDAIEAIFND